MQPSLKEPLIDKVDEEESNMFPKEYTKTDKWCGYKEKLKGSNPYIS